MSECVIEACDVRSVARGMCRMHYRRWKRHGDPLAAVQERPHKVPMEDRFWARVDKAGEYECWNWTGASKRGYGFFNHLNGQQAHRYSYELANGPIPDGMTVDHMCWNTLCQNPKHLQLLTRRANASRQRSTFDTHCPKGHPYTAENEIRTSNRMPSGNRSLTRRCRECLNEKRRNAPPRKRQYKPAPPKPPRTHCVHGHELREPNITAYALAKGNRQCLACARARAACHRRPDRDFTTIAEAKYAEIMADDPALLARVAEDLNRSIR